MPASESAFTGYLTALEHAADIAEPVRSFQVGRHFEEFVRRRWLIPTNEYLTHVMAPFLDGEIEVEVEMDEDAGLYRYRSPQYRSRILTRPLREIALFEFSVKSWLDDLASLVGAALLDRLRQPERLPGHLWLIGGFDVGGTDPAPVFIGRRWAAAPPQEVATTLADPIWPRPGIVLLHSRPDSGLPGGHQARALAEFVDTRDDADRFDAAAFGRVLRSLAVPAREVEPAQYLRGNLLKLPHFETAFPQSPTRARIIKASWGTDGHPPPIVTWAEIKPQVNTSYQSFDDAFKDGHLNREDVFALVEHGKYRLRRNP